MKPIRFGRKLEELIHVTPQDFWHHVNPPAKATPTSWIALNLMLLLSYYVLSMKPNEPESQQAPESVQPSTAEKAWVVTVNMGYGHMRGAHALQGIAYKRVIAANADRVVDKKERRRWKRMQFWYESLSRIERIPLIGKWLWAWYDQFQHIASLYPFRDLSKPTLIVYYLDRMLRKGFGHSIIEHARSHHLPFVSTFFVPPLAAAKAGLKRVYSIVTDVDINRIWVARNPKLSPVIYLVPSHESRIRLLQYGVNPENIFLTGFPLPEVNSTYAKDDLRNRIARLDKSGAFLRRYGHTVFQRIGVPLPSVDPITITFAVGGAGAQKEIAEPMLKSLSKEIRNGVFRIWLIAGVRREVKTYFEELIKRLDLQDTLGVGIKILHENSVEDYFDQFNALLRGTDILWTKPSELVFFSGLGIPIIMNPPLGAHESANRDWILRMGAGYPMENPLYTNEWLSHWIESGMLAEAAFDAYCKAPRHGTENIRRLVFSDNPSRVELLDN